MPYLNASEMMIHEEALYEVYIPLPLLVFIIVSYDDDDNMDEICVVRHAVVLRPIRWQVHASVHRSSLAALTGLTAFGGGRWCGCANGPTGF